MAIDIGVQRVAPVRRRVAVPGSTTTVFGTLVRRTAVQGAVLGTMFGLFGLVSADGYAATYRTAAQREAFAHSLQNNVGLSAILGHAWRLDTVGGFTAWRGLGVLSLVAAVWGLLSSTRDARGEEESGRLELLLSGYPTLPRATAQTAIVFAAGLACMWSALCALTEVASATRLHVPVSATLFYATSLTLVAAVFGALGLLSSQLRARRRSAAALCVAVLGWAFVIRVVSNVGANLRWAAWASPLGWVEQTHALTGSRPLALAPMVATVFAATLAAFSLAHARDLGNGALPERDTAPSHLRLLGGCVGLAWRTARATSVGWLAGMAALGLLFGLVAESAANATSASDQMRRALQRLGTRGDGAGAYLGVTFLIVATLLLLVTANQVAATRDEEASGRLDNLLTRPVTRIGWLVGRLAVAGAVVLCCGIVAGALALAGTTWTHAGVGAGSLLLAGVNAVPPAIALLGIGTLAHAVAARRASSVVYALVAWSFLVDFVGSLFRGPHWLLDTSLVYHQALAPAVGPRWTSVLILTASGVGAMAAGATLLSRRDLVTS